MEWERTAHVIYYLLAANPLRSEDFDATPEQFNPYARPKPKPPMPKLKDFSLLGKIFGNRE